MKVRILASGDVKEYDSCYALRLVDMGRAVPAEEPVAEATVAEEAAAPAEDAEDAEKAPAEGADEVSEAPKAKAVKTGKKGR